MIKVDPFADCVYVLGLKKYQMVFLMAISGFICAIKGISHILSLQNKQVLHRRY